MVLNIRDIKLVQGLEQETADKSYKRHACNMQPEIARKTENTSLTLDGAYVKDYKNGNSQLYLLEPHDKCHRLDHHLPNQSYISFLVLDL